MSEYRLTPAAQHDLSTIWDFTQKHWGASQAEAYILEIREAIERIAADPERGRKCDEIRLGYRRYAVGSHLLFYVEGDGLVDVVRILHQRMNTAQHL